MGKKSGWLDQIIAENQRGSTRRAVTREDIDRARRQREAREAEEAETRRLQLETIRKAAARRSSSKIYMGREVK